MRKLLFFIILIPAVAALGHDVYMFTQNQDKGFRLSDTGALWDKYHKESHDQWKSKLHEFEEEIEELSPLSTDETASIEQEATADTESFTQIDGKEISMPVTNKKDLPKVEPSKMQKFIGFLLEQKAIFVFSGIAALAFILNAILNCLFKKKESDSIDNRHMFRKKRKDGSYGYSRK